MATAFGLIPSVGDAPALSRFKPGFGLEVSFVPSPSAWTTFSSSGAVPVLLHPQGFWKRLPEPQGTTLRIKGYVRDRFAFLFSPHPPPTQNSDVRKRLVFICLLHICASCTSYIAFPFHIYRRNLFHYLNLSLCRACNNK